MTIKMRIKIIGQIWAYNEIIDFLISSLLFVILQG